MVDFFKMYWCSESLPMVTLFGNSFEHYYPFLVPMWFIRNLIFFVLISPCLYWLLKPTEDEHVRKISIGVLTLVCLLDATRALPMPFYLSTWKSLLFFSLGVFIQVNKVNLQAWMDDRIGRKFYFLIMVVLLQTMLFGASSTAIGGLFLNIFTLMEVVFLLKLAMNSNWSVKIANAHCFGTRLSEMTFFIFAFHIFVLHYVSSFLSMFLQYLGLNHGIGILVYVLSPIFCVMVCICAYCIFKKTMPSALHILTGR